MLIKTLPSGSGSIYHTVLVYEMGRIMTTSKESSLIYIYFDSINNVLFSRTFLQSTAFMEPLSWTIAETSRAEITIPALMYATELAWKLPRACNINGLGYEKFYNDWTCPRIALEISVSVYSRCKERSCNAILKRSVLKTSQC